MYRRVIGERRLSSEIVLCRRVFNPATRECLESVCRITAIIIKTLKLDAPGYSTGKIYN